MAIETWGTAAGASQPRNAAKPRRPASVPAPWIFSKPLFPPLLHPLPPPRSPLTSPCTATYAAWTAATAGATMMRPRAGWGATQVGLWQLLAGAASTRAFSRLKVDGRCHTYGKGSWMLAQGAAPPPFPRNPHPLAKCKSSECQWGWAWALAPDVTLHLSLRLLCLSTQATPPPAVGRRTC